MKKFEAFNTDDPFGEDFVERPQKPQIKKIKKNDEI